MDGLLTLNALVHNSEEEQCRGEMTDLESDLVLVVSLEAVLPTGDGVGVHAVSHGVAVSGPHQNGAVRGPGEQSHPTDVAAAVLQGAQPGVLVLNNLNTTRTDFLPGEGGK